MNNVSVSVIIPCRNEERFIAKCLDSLLIQDFPKENLEILVIDGMSGDKTREIVKEYAGRNPLIKLLNNSNKFTPFGLNIGIKDAKGNIIIRMDAHAGYESDYIKKCTEYLVRYNADNVGGVIKTLPARNTLIARSIAICLSHFFGAGSSYFRIGTDKPRWVDTVFGGCFNREIFQKIGFFNENLKRSQDMEFNLRLSRSGGKILLVPNIVSHYYPKDNFWGFLKHNISDGVWSIYPIKFMKAPLKLRHYIPLFFVLSLMGSAFLSIFSPLFLWLFLFISGFYLLTSLYFSYKISVSENNFRFLLLMPIAFFIRHFGYGLGSILGALKIIF